MAFCVNCGTKSEEGAKFCLQCGTPVEAVRPVQPQAVPVQAAQAVQQPVYQQPVYQQAAYQASGKNGWQYFVSALEKYAVFSGRARRAEFWWYTLFTVILSIVLTLIVQNTDWAGLAVDNPYFWQLRNSMDLFTSLVFFMPGLCVCIRRMHDVDKSGWFLLIPIYGLILLFYAGTQGQNRFGPDPKQTY